MDALFKEIAQIKGIQVTQTEEKVFIVSSTDPTRPWKIYITKDAVYPKTGTVWAWRIEDQYFDGKYASGYLKCLVLEKQTGVRVIRREPYPIPEICGDGIVCRAENREFFTMLCSNCPKAETMQAERDGVKLSYQPEDV